MRSLPRFFLLTAGLSLILCAPGSLLRAREADSQTTADEEEILDRILELRQQIEDLLEALPEEVRQQVEERWRERQAEGPEPRPEVETPAAPATRPEAVDESADALEPLSEPDVLVEPQTAAGDEIVTQTAPPCGGFGWFDTNEDALVSGGDRQWRFLRLWFDNNDDGSLDDSEIQSLFSLGVRHIDVGLRFYGDDDSDSQDVDVDDLIWLRQVGKGASSRRSGALVVTADRLARDGSLWLVAPDGTPLSGLQPLGSATILETRSGQRAPLLCQDLH